MTQSQKVFAKMMERQPRRSALNQLVTLVHEAEERDARRMETSPHYTPYTRALGATRKGRR